MNTTEPNDSPADIENVAGPQLPETGEPPPPRFRFGRMVLKAARILLLILIVAAGLTWYAYQSAQKLPEFYQTALTAPPDLLEQEGKEFESRIFDLQNESQEQGQWQAIFTEGQVNGWLATDLPEKFPDAIPPQVGHPRIRIDDEGLELAFRCRSRRFQGIIVAKGDAFCTEHPNEIAIRIKSAKAGIVPLPIGPWVDSIARTLRHAGTDTTWTEIEGDPTAIVVLPRSLTDNDDLRFQLETVQLSKGLLLLGGVTVETRKSSDIKVEEN